jgi:hypothetical protein
MKISRAATLSGILVLGSIHLSLNHSPYPPALGRINFLLGKAGEVRVQQMQTDAWIPATLQMPVRTGDKIQTQTEARCEVKLSDGSLIRIGEKSLFDFEASSLAKDGRQFQASVSYGKIWANILSLFGSKEKFEVKSPTAVCAVRGTIYSVAADSTTRVAVYDGQVDVGPTASLRDRLQRQAPRPGAPQQVPGPTRVPGPYQVTLEQWVRLVQGFQLEIRNDGRYAQSPINTALQQQDDWVQWNLARDRDTRR